MGVGRHNARLVLALVLILAAKMAAQVKLGDELNLGMTGSVAVGYNGTYGDEAGSSGHSIAMAGDGHLNGFYHSPQFAAFTLEPYYNRLNESTVYSSINSETGLLANVNLFSGSRFPGSVSFAKTYNSIGQFGVPGISGVETHGDGQNFAISWSALLPNLPTLTATFSTTSASSTVFDTTEQSQSGGNNLTLQSSYTLKGFAMDGMFTHMTTNASFPLLFEGGGEQESSTSSNSLNFNIRHPLPWHGYWSTGFRHTTYEGEYQFQNTRGVNDGSFNGMNTLASLNPTKKLTLALGADYNDNAYGSFQQQILALGGTPLPEMNSSVKLLTTSAQATYTITSHLAVFGRLTRNQTWSSFADLGVTQFSGGGTFNFAKPFLGSFNFMLGVVDTATQEGNSGASLVGIVNFMRRVRGWEVTADFGYTQQVQTLYTVYTTSMLNYGTSLKHRIFWDGQWAGSFNASKSGLQQFAGMDSHSESFSSNVFFRRFSVSGQYTQSAGTSILTPTGLVAVPGVPLPLLNAPILYDAKSVGGAISVYPTRKSALTVNYATANSSTSGPSAAAFESRIYQARYEYRLRKVHLEADFIHFEQNVGNTILPAVVNSYYIRATRWFNIF